MHLNGLQKAPHTRFISPCVVSLLEGAGLHRLDQYNCGWGECDWLTEDGAVADTDQCRVFLPSNISVDESRVLTIAIKCQASETTAQAAGKGGDRLHMHSVSGGHTHSYQGILIIL